MEKCSGLMRLTGGTGKTITETAIKTGDWSKIEKEFGPMDLINVLECFDLSPERREWVNELLERKIVIGR
jgi:predicted nucleotidyltransferase